MEREINKEDHKRTRILCIEDNNDDYEVIRHSLEKKMKGSITLERVSTGREGLTLMYRNKYDVLLLDYLLPDMNGIEIMEMMKKEGLDIPIIMLTGKGDENIAVEAMKKGVNDYIIKDDLETEKLSESITKVVDLTMFLKQWDTGFPDIHGLGKRRDTLTILANVLTTSAHGISKTKLVYKTNLNFKTVNRYLAFLLTNDFLSIHHIKGKGIFKTTKKGFLLLKQLKDIKEYFE